MTTAMKGATMKRSTAIRFLPIIALILAGLSVEALADTVKKEFTVGKGGTLRLELEAEVVQIITKEGTSVVISVEDIDERFVKDLEITQQGDNVSVEFKPRRRKNEARFFITIPVEYNVSAEYAGGRFEIGDLLKGTLDLETGGGNVDIGTITGKTSIKTGGGNLEARELGSDAAITTGGGNVEIDKVGMSAKVTSGGGNLRLKEIGKDLDLTTGGGNVRIGDVKGLAEISTGGGNVDLGPVSGVVSVKTGGGNLDVSGGNGSNKVKTGGGNVELKQMTGSVDVTSGGGNVEVGLTPKGNDDSRVHSGGGDITLSLPADAKATVEATLNMRRGEPGEYKIITEFKAEKHDVDEDGNAEALVKVNGGGQRIMLETTDGDIRIRKQ